MFKNSYLVYTSFVCLVVLMSSCKKEKVADVIIPEKVTYSNTVAQILINNGCAGCHAAGATSPELSNYEKVKTNVDGVIGSISHANGFSPMPKNSPKISAAQIKALTDWKTQGLLQ